MRTDLPRPIHARRPKLAESRRGEAHRRISRWDHARISTASPAHDDEVGVSHSLLLLLLLLAGCSFFSRSQSEFFTIEPVPAPAVTNVGGIPVALDGVELPPGFDRREVVVRKADQQLEVRSAEQWSASLQPLVLHTLAFDLASRLPQGMVILPGEAQPPLTRAIDVVFTELVAGPEARLVIDAQIAIRTGGAATATRHERIEIPLASTASDEVAAGMSRGLATLADRIAAALAAR